MSKVIEKVVSSQLQNHLSDNSFHEAFQSAYKKGHSTETALLRVQNDILRAVDSGQGACLVLLDLSAAFDTIDHEILLSSMNSQLGVKGTALQWFRSYLNNHIQSVIVNNVVSSPSPLKFGVPQGSVLGPLLFCTYMIPLGDIIRKHGMMFHIYADDTQIYCFFNAKIPSTADLALDKMRACIKQIRAWMIQSRLKLNDDKTEFIVLSSPHYQKTFNNLVIQIGEADVKSTSKVRNLGVLFDSSLNMKDQVSAVCKSSIFQLRMIGAVRRYLTDDACAQLIHAFVTSRIDYCNSLLASLPQSQYAKLQKLQNIAARILSRTRKFDHITPVLIQLHWLPIPLRIHFKIILLTFKCVAGIGPSYLEDLLSFYCPTRSLRSSSKCLLQTVPAKMATYGSRAFSIVAPQLWNSLPFNLRTAKSVESFKIGLKTHLFQLFIANPSSFIMK